MPTTEELRVHAALAAAEGWPGVRDGETMRSVALPGMTLAIRRRAAALDGLDPALFVHGLGGSSRNWSALMERLSSDVECEAVDLPGFGASPPARTADYSLYGHARAVIRCLEASERGPVHLFGNSLGGAVATRVAALRPDLVRSLTLVSPALPELNPQRTALPTGLLGVPGVTRLLRRVTRDQPPGQRARQVLRLCYGDPARITLEEFTAAEAELERRQSLPYFWDSLTRSTRGLVNAYTLGGQHSLWRQAERVLAPTLLMYGVRDRLVSFRVARRASRAFGWSRLVVLPEAGHMAMMEYPEEVATAFRDFLPLTTPAGAG
ncbi:alpha/beta fold hydrolase [Streptomyces radicis]|uniref:Alpha/beta fold hydrolase n=1 Tax=Streptomyces radicis TaxID=1750517 RepID=A0A3A9W9S2_9ACTN|nr:alpha/beta fold hydrolase [Streptomyces radicis]RKN09103.1 alpha/beta fold hydrolase [Streptomyces radicis]RKN22906.1 alpha/beta fold hydrolase [Streptomyces radicis]